MNFSGVKDWGKIIKKDSMKNLGVISKFLKQFWGGERKKTIWLRRTEYNYMKRRIEVLEKLLDEKSSCVEKAKSVFLRNLYHEIRTPLNSIVGFSDLIEMNNLDVKEKESYIAHIRESSQEFLNKMDNIIEASIIEAGLLKMSIENCRLYDLFSEIHSYFSLHKHIVDKNIALLLSVPPELKEIEVKVDSFRLSQILTNLISNAFKFTSRGIIEFGFKLKLSNIEFFVKDTGVGGLEGKENEIYRNFNKLNDPENESKGLGLGLSLSKKLIELMNGAIWYDSVVEKGTTFYFTIPYMPGKSNSIKKTGREKNILNLRRTLQQTVIL